MTKAFKAVRHLTKAVPSSNASVELMAWLKEKPQTHGWGAIVAYDREEANKMLRQEYISRFNSESIMLPVSLEISGSAEIKKLYGYEFDAPLMSFENYSDTDIKDEPRCVIRLPIIAGSYMTLGAKGVVTSISVLDPLDGQVLSMTMDLKTGMVNDKNQVMFNIAEGTSFSVDVNEHYLDQDEVGRAFKAYFEEDVPDEKKVWALSQIDTSKNHYLKPAVVKLEVRRRAAYGEIADGELIICVAMEGDTAGTSLPDDFKYLTDSNSATFLLGQQTLLSKVVGKNVNASMGNLASEIQLSGVQYRLRYLEGFIRANARKVTYTLPGSYPADITFPNVDLTYAPGNDLLVSVVEDCIEIRWRCENYATIQFFAQGGNYPTTTLYGVGAYKRSRYKVSHDGRGVESAGIEREQDFLYITVLDDKVIERYVEGYVTSSDYKTGIFNDVKVQFAGLFHDVPEINTFVLESILFKNEDTVTLSSCALPNDLVMFGDVGPTATAFEITPMEAVILYGKSKQFELTPHGPAGVTWTVESASDTPGFVGTINSISGLYNAPDLSDYQGAQVRVRVIATYGNYRTYALVSVLKKTITVNPLVTVKIINDPPSPVDKVTLTANSADGVAPTWRIKITGNEGTLDSPTGFTNVYTPRPYELVDDLYVVDEIILTDSEGNEHSAVIVMVHEESRIKSAMKEGSSTATTVQLQCKDKKKDVTENTEFNMLLGGSGTISESGLYTQAQNIISPFALVECVTTLPENNSKEMSFILIPLPLSPSSPVK